MSNRLIRAARQVEQLIVDGEQRPIFASEKAVLVALADDARDSDGGRTSLGATELSRRTSCSLRTVKRALMALVDAGQISRAHGAVGEAALTSVHPKTAFASAMSPVPPRHGTRATMTRDPCHHGTGPIETPDSTNIPVTSAGAREPVELDEVGQVFDEWDRVAAAKGLPGPVVRDVPREAAVRQKLAEQKLWRVLALVRAVGESDFLRGRRPVGQGDWRADFDQVFGVGRFASNRMFTRLLEGSFGVAVPTEPPAARASITTAKSDQPPDEGQLLQAAATSAWADALDFAWDGDELTVSARSHFVVDQVETHRGVALRAVARQLRGPAATVRIVFGARQPVGASP